MHGAAPDALPAVVVAKLDRVVAADDALAEPEKFLLLVFVGDEVLERPPKRAGIERDDRKPGLGQLAGKVPPPAPVPTIAKSTSSSSR